MSIAVSARGISKTYRDGVRQVKVLDGVEMQIEPGERLAVIGPSGSGKSTLLHLLGALDQPDEGEIVIDGQRIAQIAPRELARFRNRKIGFVFQSHQLLPDFNALENAMMPGRIAGLDADETLRRALALLDEVGLAERLDHFPSQLSGGECQRVALCRALLMEPPLLLADEPTGNLDPASAEHVFELLIDLQKRHGTTAVLVTHNPLIAQRCGRILSLESGVLRPADMLRTADVVSD